MTKATKANHDELFKAQDGWHKRVLALQSLHRTILESHSVEPLLQTLAKCLVEIFPDANVCLIWQNDPEKNTLHLAGRWSASGSLPPPLDQVTYQIPAAQSLSGEVIAQRQPSRVEYDTQNQERFFWKPLAKQLSRYGMLAVLVPSVGSDVPLGCINIFTTSPTYRFPDEDVDLLENIAGSVAVGFNNIATSLLLRTHEEIAECCAHDPRSPQTLDKVAETVRDKVRAEGSSVFLVDAERNVLRLGGTTGIKDISPRSYGSVVYAPGDGYTGWVMKLSLIHI